MKRLLWTLLTVYVLIVIAEFVVMYAGAPLRPMFWQHAARTCQYLALVFGRAGLKSEHFYHRAVSEL